MLQDLREGLVCELLCQTVVNPADFLRGKLRVIAQQFIYGNIEKRSQFGKIRISG